MAANADGEKVDGFFFFNFDYFLQKEFTTNKLKLRKMTIIVIIVIQIDREL